jgi:hypothetical protein
MHDAVQIPWCEVTTILGHDHHGHAEDDHALVEHLVAVGSPGWVRDADGWIDDLGWGLIGPERAQATDDQS